MQRRRYLHACAGTALLAATSGCLDDQSPVDSTPADVSTPTGDGTTSSSDDAADGDAADGDETFGEVSVLSVETFPLALRLNDAGQPAGGAPSVVEFDDRERSVVEAALDDGYTTDTVPEWLARFATETGHVRHEGSFYALDASLPVHVVTAEPVERSAVDGEIATSAEYREAVTFDDYVLSGFARIARTDGYRTYVLREQLRSFVQQYDATEYRGGVLRLDYAVEDSGPPYTVVATETSPAEVYGGSVLFADEAAPEIAALLRAAGPEDGLYRVADPPADLASLVEDHRYVHADGSFYHAYVETATDEPVSFDVTAAEPADGDPRVRFSVRNGHDVRMQVMSGAPAPFGVLTAEREDDGDHATLWTNAYESSDHVMVEDGEVTGWNSIGLRTHVQPGESVEHSYRLRAGDFETGEWIVENDVEIGFRDPGDDPDGDGPVDSGGALSYRVTFRVTEH